LYIQVYIVKLTRQIISDISLFILFVCKKKIFSPWSWYITLLFIKVGKIPNGQYQKWKMDIAGDIQDVKDSSILNPIVANCKLKNPQ
jgi:hypothetical protein